MTAVQSTHEVTRDAILNLLSDQEVARVSNAEAANTLTAGDDYVDLQCLDRGVQSATGSTQAVMGHVLPRSAVGGATWAKIVALLPSGSR
jgi:hypothetical protein